VIDLEPRPPHMVARTRQMAVGSASATRIDAPPSAPAPSPEPAKVGIGRETLEREIGARLGEERRASARLAVYGVAAIVLLTGITAAALHFRASGGEERTAAAVQETRRQIEQTDAKLKEAASAARKALEAKVGQMSRQEIAAAWADSTVLIEAAWRLYDRDSGKQVFHRCRSENGTCRLLYVGAPDGTVVPWLTTDDENHSNIPVAGSGTGSGFVVHENGFILTNRHVAGGWLDEYDRYRAALPTALVVPQGGSIAEARPPVAAEAAQMMQQMAWVPAQGGRLFQETRAVPVSDRADAFEGRAELLDVRFPGNNLSIGARFVRASNEADVALIKIEAPQALRPVVLADDGHAPALGEPVTVIGYPAISEQTLALQTTQQGGNLRVSSEVIPEPTVTDGIVANIGSPLSRAADDAALLTVGTMGDVYQLTATATGAGNSGGPVFNAAGQVIGLFTYMRTGEHGERVTFAVPIRYGQKILRLNRVTPYTSGPS
jgi:S1-C subfamily serine protease